jgi:hypothetical protein
MGDFGSEQAQHTEARPDVIAERPAPVGLAADRRTVPNGGFPRRTERHVQGCKLAVVGDDDVRRRPPDLPLADEANKSNVFRRPHGSPTLAPQF